jgi:hypothetical protein
MKRRCYYYKHLIIIIILVLIYLSGCLDKLTTFEKQTCLTATHYAQTSVPSCNSQQSCYNKLKAISLNNSNQLPINISNKIEFYKNNISSSMFYFNESKKLLDKVNSSCKNNKFDLELIDNVNSLFYNISRIFSYVDKSTENSISILKDYAIYFKNQDIYEISEEELYSDFIEINNNLNELQKENIESENYAKYIKTDSAQVNFFAKELGFKKTYLSKVNYIDLYSYYFDLTNNPQESLYVPKSGLSSTYIITLISKIENINKINEKLKMLNSYDLYLLYDRMFGFDNSTLIRFKNLNNKIINNYDVVLNKIKDLENYSLENYDYLDNHMKAKFIKNKFDYKHNNLSFGKYLSILKDINNNIEYNKLNLENIDENNNEIINNCNIIIKDNKKTNNMYLQYLINNYELEDNLILKIELCEKIKNNLNYENCTQILSDILLSNISELENLELMDLNEITSKQCNYILGNINYILENNLKIKYLNEIVNENLFLILESKKIEHDNELEIIEIEFRVKEIKDLENYMKIQNIDSLIEESLKTNSEIKKINKNILELYISENLLIRNINNNYYLEINNIFNYKIYDLEILHHLENITSNDERLNIKTKYLSISYLNNSLNYFNVNYNNKQNIFEEIIILNLDKSLLEINIENTIIGIEDKLFVGDAEVIDNSYYIDANQFLHYTTLQNNEILLLKQILDQEIIEIDLQEISNNKFIENKLINIINTTNKTINQKLYYKDYDEDEIIVIKQNNIELLLENINNYLTFNINIGSYSTKTYQIITLKSLEDVLEEIQNIITILQSLRLSVFNNISQQANNINLEIKSIDEYTLIEIQEIYLIMQDILNILQLENTCKNIEDLYNIKINEIRNYELISSEEDELNYIESIKYNDIGISYNRLLLLESLIIERLNSQEVIEIQEIEDDFNNILELIKEHNINNINNNIEDLINEFNENENLIEKRDILNNLYQEINNSIKINLKEIFELIINYEKIDLDKFNLNLEILSLQFENIDLLDLYSIEYYPKINLYDIERISKKSKELQTKTFLSKIQNFKDKYNNNEFEQASKILSISEIQKIKDFIKEVDFVNSYIEEIKNYSLQLIKNSSENTDLAKEKYESKRYFEVIYLLKKSNLQNLNKNNYINNNNNILQNIIIIIVFGVLFLVYLYFNKNKKQKINYKERKQKVIRHY